MKRLVLSVLAVAACLPASDSRRFTEDFHYAYPLSPGGTLSISSFNGSIEITGWDQNTVDISGTKYAETAELRDAIRLDIQAGATAVRIVTVRPEQRGSMGVKYVIKVPRRTELESVVSSNAGVRVTDIEGNVKLVTSNGPIHTAQVRGHVNATTSNGPLRMQGALGRVDATSSNGPVELALDAAPLEDIRARTSNGSITVRMPDLPGARLNAQTSNGRVHSDFNVTRQGSLDDHHVEGTINSGGPTLELRTSNGSIRLARR